jgi:fructose-1,6-bisphosphatase/inositol monophosphatase family enzyme
LFIALGLINNFITLYLISFSDEKGAKKNKKKKKNKRKKNKVRCPLIYETFSCTSFAFIFIYNIRH